MASGERGGRRARWLPDSTRSSSRGAVRAARWAGTAPSTTATTSRASSTAIDCAQRIPNPSTYPTTIQRVLSESRSPAVWWVSCSITAVAASTRPSVRITAMPCGVRRIASTVHATTWPTAVAAMIQMTMPISATSSEPPLDAVRRDAHQDPGLQQPRDVEGCEQERAEVVGGRADGVDDGVLAVEQLSAAAGGDRRGDRDDHEARHGGRDQQDGVEGVPLEVPALSTIAGTVPAARVRPTKTAAPQGEGTRPADGRGAEVDEVADVLDGAAYLSPGGCGRHVPPPRRPSHRRWRRRPAPRRAGRGRRCTPGRRARAGGWRRARRRRGRARR